MNPGLSALLDWMALRHQIGGPHQGVDSSREELPELGIDDRDLAFVGGAQEIVPISGSGREAGLNFDGCDLTKCHDPRVIGFAWLR